MRKFTVKKNNNNILFKFVFVLKYDHLTKKKAKILIKVNLGLTSLNCRWIKDG